MLRIIQKLRSFRRNACLYVLTAICLFIFCTPGFAQNKLSSSQKQQKEKLEAELANLNSQIARLQQILADRGQNPDNQDLIKALTSAESLREDLSGQLEVLREQVQEQAVVEKEVQQLLAKTIPEAKERIEGLTPDITVTKTKDFSAYDDVMAGFSKLKISFSSMSTPEKEQKIREHQAAISYKDQQIKQRKEEQQNVIQSFSDRIFHASGIHPKISSESLSFAQSDVGLDDLMEQIYEQSDFPLPEEQRNVLRSIGKEEANKYRQLEEEIDIADKERNEALKALEELRAMCPECAVK